MTWTQKYWDIVDQFYWTPNYLGLKSIPREQWTIEDDVVSIPKDMTNPNGPLYRRTRSGDEYWSFVRRQEETFNHIFDLAFAILPGDVVSDVFGITLGADISHDYESLGREIHTRYFWGEHDNITTPDGFFVAKDAIFAVELKFNAKTSLDQLAKYMMLLIAEEKHANQRARLDLLYVFNSDPRSSFEFQVGRSPDNIDGSLSAELVAAVANQTVHRYLSRNEGALKSTLDRINIHCISWRELRAALTNFSDQLQAGRGDRTLKRLIDGLSAEIAAHPLSNVGAEESG